MRKFLRIRLMFYLLFLISVAFSSGQAKGPLTNRDVTDMLKGNLPESTIILSIQQAEGSKFDTSPAALIQLKADGATQKILDAVVLNGKLPSAAETDRTVVESGINNVPRENAEDVVGYFSVSLLDGTNKRPLQWVPFDTKTYSGKRMIPYAGVFFKKDTYNKILGSHSEFKMTNTTPRFELTLTSGVRASTIVNIIKLEITDTARRIMVSQEGVFRTTNGIRQQDIIPSSLEEVRSSASTGFTLYRLTPSSPLKPGEYAIVVNGTQFYDFSIVPLP